MTLGSGTGAAATATPPSATGRTGGNGTLAQYTTGTPVNFAFGEPERGVLYRLNCIIFAAVTGVTLNRD
jgi:hypothetical protein